MATLPTLPSLPTIPTIPSILPEIPTFKSVTSPVIADSIFSTGVKDSVVVGDVYDIKNGSSPITSIQEIDLQVDTSFFGKLDGSSPADFLSKLKDGLEFDPDTLAKRVAGTQSELKAAFGELTESAKKGALLNTFKDKAKFINATIGETKSLVSAAKINDVKSLGNFVNKYTNSKVFNGKDKGALGGLLSSVVKTSSDLGVSGAFTTLTNTVNDNGILGKMTRTLLPVVVSNSDSKLLKEMTTGNSAKLVNVFAPGFTQNFSKAFVYKGTNTKSLDNFEDIVGSFKNINASWDKTERGASGNTATNLWSIIKGSKDFQNLILTGVSYWTSRQKAGATPPVEINKMHSLATAFSEVSVGKAISRDFPRVTLLSVYNAKIVKAGGLTAGTRKANNSKAIDPRLLKSGLSNLLG